MKDNAQPKKKKKQTNKQTNKRRPFFGVFWEMAFRVWYRKI
jgi:hypothetical protein